MESRERDFCVSLDSLPLAALVVEMATLRVRASNRRAQALFGRIGDRNLPLLIPDLDRPALLRLIDGPPIEVTLADARDRPSTAELRVAVVDDQDPRSPGAVLVTLNDATERVRTEASLRHAFLAQKTLSDLLRVTRGERPLAHQLRDALELLVDLPWAPFGPAAAVLLGETELVLTASVGQLKLQRGGLSHWQSCACSGRVLDGEGRFGESRILGVCSRNLLVAPLEASGRSVGRLLIQGPSAEELDPFETELLATVTQHLGQVVAFARTRDAMSERSQHLRLMVERAVHAVLGLDESGRITAFNPAAERMFGLDRAEALTQGYADLLPELGPRGLAHALGAPIELEGRRRDGSRFPVLLELTETRARGASAFTAFIRDETARKQAEAELVRAREAALEASRTKSRFLANMSHEIRTPMNGVIGMTDILLTTELDEAQRDAVDTIRSSSEALLAVINDVLDFSRIEAGKLEISRAPFELRRVVVDVVRLLRPKTEGKNVRLETSVAEDVPSWVVGDDGRIRQILINLLGNAVKFTEKGAVRLAIRRTEADGVAFAVSDTGIGMSPEALAGLFQPFVQADGSITRRFGGTGLGLTISRQLADLMGGTLLATSIAGEGSTFELGIPLPATQALDQVSTEDILAIDFSGLDILLVEDNAVNQKVATRLLERLGTRVSIANNGREALEQLEQRSFHLVLMDCQMPVMDGYEATREIRRRKWSVPIVALTANAMKGDADKCKQAGMDEFLSKPVRRKELEQMLARVAVQHDLPIGHGLPS